MLRYSEAYFTKEWAGEGTSRGFMFLPQKASSAIVTRAKQLQEPLPFGSFSILRLKTKSISH